MSERGTIAAEFDAIVGFPSAQFVDDHPYVITVQPRGSDRRLLRVTIRRDPMLWSSELDDPIPPHHPMRSG